MGSGHLDHLFGAVYPRHHRLRPSLQQRRRQFTGATAKIDYRARRYRIHLRQQIEERAAALATEAMVLGGIPHGEWEIE